MRVVELCCLRIWLRKFYFTYRFIFHSSYQLAFHLNIPRVNEIWRKLEYFSPTKFLVKLEAAHRILQMKKHSSGLLIKNFVLDEGWYSQLVFRNNMTVKIISRGFDEFRHNPVVLNNGQLVRCMRQAKGTLANCIENLQGRKTVTVHKLPAMQVVEL